MHTYSQNLNSDNYKHPESQSQSNWNPQRYQGPSSSTAPSLTGLGARPSSAGYQHDSGHQSFTPTHGDVGHGHGEDIRAKLARYKQERQDFEKVRMQFRQKNAEIERKNSQTLPKMSSFVP